MDLSARNIEVRFGDVKIQRVMMEHPKALLFVIIALASCLGLAYPISTTDCMNVYATWGTGKYTIDLGIYHKEVKPIFLSEFKKIDKFEAYCGSNPDFEIDRKGIVNPSAVEKKKISLGKCLKKTFSLDLGGVVLDHIPKQDESDDGSESSFTAFATWGVGKYTIDLGIYHKEVKPIFLSEFKKIDKFEAYCGSNPDFEIDRKGIVNPSAVEKKKIQLGKCLKKTFSLDLGEVVLDHIPKQDESDDGSESSLTAFATWGVGKYTIDLGIYHAEVKPIFLAAYKKMDKFEAYCGSNPDFEITRKGVVSPSAVEKKKISLGKCLKKTFSRDDLGEVVLEHIPEEKAPDDESDDEKDGGSDDESEDGSDSSLTTFEGNDDGDSEPKLLPSGLRALPIIFSAWFEGIYASGIMTVLS